MLKGIIKRYYKCVICLLLVCIAIEVFVFNFRHWESCFFETPEEPTIQVAGAVEQVDDTVYHVIGDIAEITITDINVPLRNVHLNCFDLWEMSAIPGQRIGIRLFAADEANSMLTSLPDTEVVVGLPESHYIRLHLVGDTTSIRIQLLDFQDGVFDLNGIFFCRDPV